LLRGAEKKGPENSSNRASSKEGVYYVPEKGLGGGKDSTRANPLPLEQELGGGDPALGRGHGDTRRAEHQQLREEGGNSLKRKDHWGGKVPWQRKVAQRSHKRVWEGWSNDEGEDREKKGILT